MAHDGSQEEESVYKDAQDTNLDAGLLVESRTPVQVKLSFDSAAVSLTTSDSLSTSGSPAAKSAPTVPISSFINRQDTAESSEVLHDNLSAQRRTQSEGNLTGSNSSLTLSFAADSASPVTFLASPSHSASAFLAPSENEGVTPLPPSISVKTTADTTSNRFMTVKETLLADNTPSTSSKSPREQVHVIYPLPGPLFVDLFSRDDGTGAKVKGFRRKRDGSMAATEASGRVFPDDELVAINHVDVTKMAFNEIITTAQEAEFPLKLTFHCHYATNKEESDRHQSPIIERKHSSGPLPPISPSSRVGWGARLSQMTRTSSFEQQKTSGTDRGTERPKSPSTAEANGGKFGLSSLGKVGTDGVKKSLFRMIGNKPVRPEEDKTVVKGWMEDLALKPQTSVTGRRHRKAPAASLNVELLHSTPIVAVTTGGRFIGVLDEDVYDFALSWFRKLPQETEIQAIQGVHRCPYFPSVDDVGAILSLRCESLRFPHLQRIVELPQPLKLDPDVGNTVQVFLEAGAGSFSATLASHEHDSFQLKISAESVTLVKISEEAGGVVVVEARYGPYLQVLLDPSNQLRFTLKVQEFGAFLGNRDGDVCDFTTLSPHELATLSCFFLVAQNRQNRDILTLLIRQFRARVVTPAQEQLAQADERALFMDPAFVVATKPPSPALSSLASPSTAVSPTAATGETASTAGSPTAGTTSTLSPGSRLQREGSVSAFSDARLSDLLGLEREDSGHETRDDKPRACGSPVPFSTSISKSSVGETSRDQSVVVANGFVDGRLAAQEKEMAMLRAKLASMSIRLKAAMQEKKLLVQSFEVKENRIEAQHMKIRQLEKVAAQWEHHVQELDQLQFKWQEEARQHAACRDKLERVTAKQASSVQEESVQTEAAFLDGERMAGSGWKRDSMTGTIAIVRAKDLQQQVMDQKVQIAQLEDEQVQLIAERNVFRAKAIDLAKELKKLVGTRPLDDVEKQVKETTRLEGERVEGESVDDKEKRVEHLVEQNRELQETVHQLKDALSEARDQVEAVKKVNSALASRLQRLHPDDSCGRIGESVVTGQDAFSEDDDEEDDEEEEEEEEEDEELRDGIAAFRRSLVGNNK